MTNRWTRLALAAAAGVLVSTAALAAQSAHTPHWGYGAENGPAHWAAMNPANALCAAGKRQSPIDIPAGAPTQAAPVAFGYTASAASVVNNGHTIQVDLQNGGTLRFGGKTYTLKQFHFHTPSENTVSGKHYPMVAHLVHVSSSGELAVVAVMFVEGEGGGVVDALPRPGTQGAAQAVPGSVDAVALLPADKAHYTFEGSLTTPPCSEGVQWIVMKTPVPVSHATLAGFEAILHDNARPTNALNGRAVTVSD